MREEIWVVIGFVLKGVLGVQKYISLVMIIFLVIVDFFKVFFLISEQVDLNEDVELEIIGNK